MISQYLNRTPPRTRIDKDGKGLMKRTLSVIGAAVLLSMMALMFLGGLLKKAAHVVDGLRNGSG